MIACNGLPPPSRWRSAAPTWWLQLKTKWATAASLLQLSCCPAWGWLTPFVLPAATQLEIHNIITCSATQSLTMLSPITAVATTAFPAPPPSGMSSHSFAAWGRRHDKAALHSSAVGGTVGGVPAAATAALAAAAAGSAGSDTAVSMPVTAFSSLRSALSGAIAVAARQNVQVLNMRSLGARVSGLLQRESPKVQDAVALCGVVRARTEPLCGVAVPWLYSRIHARRALPPRRARSTRSTPASCSSRCVHARVLRARVLALYSCPPPATAPASCRQRNYVAAAQHLEQACVPVPTLLALLEEQVPKSFRDRCAGTRGGASRQLTPRVCHAACRASLPPRPPIATSSCSARSYPCCTGRGETCAASRARRGTPAAADSAPSTAPLQLLAAVAEERESRSARAALRRRASTNAGEDWLSALDTVIAKAHVAVDGDGLMRFLAMPNHCLAEDVEAALKDRASELHGAHAELVMLYRIKVRPCQRRRRPQHCRQRRARCAADRQCMRRACTSKLCSRSA